LLHHLAELPGHRQPPLARIARRLDEEDVAADRGDREPGRHARVGRPLAHVGREAARPEPLADARLVEPDLLRLPLRDLRCRLATERGDLALQSAYAGLARVLADDDPEHAVAEPHLTLLEPVRLELLRH